MGVEGSAGGSHYLDDNNDIVFLQILLSPWGSEEKGKEVRSKWFKSHFCINKKGREREKGQENP